MVLQFQKEVYVRYKTKSMVLLISPSGKIKRREVELDTQVSPKEIMSREVELGCESWTSFASSCSSVQRSATDIVFVTLQLKQQLRSALVAAQW